MKCRYMGGYLAVTDSAHEIGYLKKLARKFTCKSIFYASSIGIIRVIDVAV